MKLRENDAIMRDHRSPQTSQQDAAAVWLATTTEFFDIELTVD